MYKLKYMYYIAFVWWQLIDIPRFMFLNCLLLFRKTSPDGWKQVGMQWMARGHTLYW